MLGPEAHTGVEASLGWSGSDHARVWLIFEYERWALSREMLRHGCLSRAPVGDAEAGVTARRAPDGLHLVITLPGSGEVWIALRAVRGFLSESWSIVGPGTRGAVLSAAGVGGAAVGGCR